MKTERLTWQQRARQMKPIGLVLWWTFTIKIHKDGDGATEVYNWWHPLSYAMIVLMLLPCAIVGEKITDVVRFAPKPYWDDKRSTMEWLSHF